MVDESYIVYSMTDEVISKTSISKALRKHGLKTFEADLLLVHVVYKHKNRGKTGWSLIWKEERIHIASNNRYMD